MSLSHLGASEDHVCGRVTAEVPRAACLHGTLHAQRSVMKRKTYLPILSTLLMSGLTVAAIPGCLSQDAQDEIDGADLDKGIPKIEIIRNASGQYRFNVKANNGEVVLRSESYQTLAGATNGVESVKTNGADLEQYVLLQTTNGKWYFNLRAGNNKIIATSEIYSSKSNAKRGMKTAAAILAWVDGPEIFTSMQPRFVTFKALDGKYYTQLVGAYGDVMLRSKAYATKASANNAIDKLYEVGVDSSAFVAQEAQNGQTYFVVKDGSSVLAYGQPLSSYQDLNAGKEAANALLRQLTPAPKVVCTLTRRAGVPVQYEEDGEIFTAAEAGPASQDVLMLMTEEGAEPQEGVQAYLGKYWISLRRYEDLIYVMFSESEIVADETGDLECNDAPANVEDDRIFCKEPIIIDANLGVPDMDDSNDVHAFDFSCQYR